MQSHQNNILGGECSATEEALCEPRKELFITSVADLPSGELNGVTIGPCFVIFGIHSAE